MPEMANTFTLPADPPLTLLPDDDSCNICCKEVLDTDQALFCDRCSRWTHNSCNKVTKKQYTFHKNNPDAPFECSKCRKCGICCKTIAKNHRYLDCTNCENKIHIKCTKFSNDKDCKFYRENPALFTCSDCLCESLPFLQLDNNKFKLTADAINYPDDSDPKQMFLSESQQEILNKFNSAIDEISNNLQNEKDDPADNILPCDCKYYTVDDFNSRKATRN